MAAADSVVVLLEPMFNGIRPQPPNKWFNSAYLQNKFLICRKIPSNRPGCQVVLEKKIFWKQKNQNQIFNWGSPRQARQAKKQVAFENSLRLNTCKGPAAAAEAV